MGVGFSQQHYFYDQDIDKQQISKQTISQINKNNQKDMTKKNNSNINIMHFYQLGGQVKIDKQRNIYFEEFEVYENSQKSIIELLDRRIQLKHKNFVTVRNYNIMPLDNSNRRDSEQKWDWGYICKPEQKYLRIQFDPLFFNVQSLIKMYCQQRRPLEEYQIRRIIKETVECLIFLSQNQTYHGDIKPTTIFINPKTTQVKLADSLLFNKGKTAFQIVIQDPRSESFLTPKQLQKNRKGIPENLQQIHESEIFCIGMTMLEMMTFESSMEAYNLQQLEIKVDFIQRKLQQMKQYGYSFQLADLALRCIHKNSSQRPRFQQIFNLL